MKQDSIFHPLTVCKNSHKFFFTLCHFLVDNVMILTFASVFYAALCALRVSSTSFFHNKPSGKQRHCQNAIKKRQC